MKRVVGEGGVVEGRAQAGRSLWQGLAATHPGTGVWRVGGGRRAEAGRRAPASVCHEHCSKRPPGAKQVSLLSLRR